MRDGIVKALFDKDGYLIKAGELETNTLKERRKMGDYLMQGCVIKDIPIDEFRKTDWKWIWDKPV